MIYKFRRLELIRSINKNLKKLLIRIAIAVFCIPSFSLAPSDLLSQSTKIIIEADTLVSIDEVFRIVKRQTDYTFVYHQDLFKRLPHVHLKKGVIKLEELLANSLAGGDIDVIFSTNNKILIKEKNIPPTSQQYRVSGTVTDESGMPISGVTVLIKDIKEGAVTDFDGHYSIVIGYPIDVLVLVFSYLGYKTQEFTVGEQRTINVVLKEEIGELEAVTINAGYYNTTERERTGSIVTIDAKTIEKQPVNNPLAAMQGHLSGVNIIQNNGLPGGGFRVQVRGQNFIDIDKGGIFGNTNEPLYIIDGVPFNSGTLEDLDLAASAVGPGMSPLNAINPADIKSIEVLKDADATAIYGSRGANGVVLITTKKGKEGKTQVKLNVSTTLSEVTGFIDVLNTEEYLEIRREALTNDRETLEFEPQSQIRDLLFWDETRDTDWQDVLLGGTAYRQNAQLSFSGGSAQTQFLLSGGYSTETTVFPGNSKYNKTSILTNINHRSEDDRFVISFSGSYNADTNNLPTVDLTNPARTLAPNAPPLYNEEGNLNWENFQENPLAFLETKYNATSQNLIANTTISYHPVPSLELKTSMGYIDYRLKSYRARPHTSLSPVGQTFYDSRNSRISTNDSERQSWIIEPQINWRHNWGDTNVKLLFGATFQQNGEQQIGLSGRGFSSNKQLLDVSAADFRDIRRDTESEYKYQSFFGRLNLNHRGKYIVNLTGRRDGSSRFGPGKQFGYFGAVGTAWLFSEETLFKGNSILSFGKLRASYGITGSDNIGNYNFLDTYETGRTYIVRGLSPTRLFNPDFAWEETKKLEAALELGFFNDRILINTAWYRNRSSNQIIQTPLSVVTGFNGVNNNFDAIVENSGIEIDLRTTNVKNDHFKWQTTLNISANRNKLVAFPELEGSTFEERLVIGYPLRVSQSYHFIGVNPESGIAQFTDFNNDGRLNQDDRKLLDDFTPKHFGGLGNTFQYKGIQLEVFFQFAKQKALSYLSVMASPGQNISNLPVSTIDRWRQVNDQSGIQRAVISDRKVFEAWDNYKLSNAAIIDASFIRLRNVSLSYAVPKAITNAFDLNIYLQGQNLFVMTTYDGADPEVRFRLPPLRQFTLGLNLSF